MSGGNNSLFDTEKTWMQRDFGIDRRLVKGIAKIGFSYPTLVQSKCIPIALEGKDVLVRARTGSGKTLAFSLPAIHKILQSKLNGSYNAGTNCVILAPTKELIKQIEKNILDVCYYCRDVLTVVSLTDDNQKVLDMLFQKKPDIIITTPAKLAQQITKQKIVLNHITTLVIDEADLILSFGYKEDINVILNHIPKGYQGILTSATLSSELDKFKKLILHQPAILKLEEAENKGNLLQFYLESTERDKYLILYVFLKLGLLQVKLLF